MIHSSASGTFKFTFEGTRIKKEDTPAEVSAVYPPIAALSHSYLKLGMEDGDQIDAFLEQVGLRHLVLQLHMLNGWHCASLEEGLGCRWNHNVFASVSFLVSYLPLIWS
jgi:hypothetical protein